MLIVSKNLIQEAYEDDGFAWQLDESEKRDPDRYVAATQGSLELKKVVERVRATAKMLDLPDDVPFGNMLIKLEKWAYASEKEVKVWQDKKAVNAPIFDKALWDERAAEKRPAEVRVYDNAVDLVLALVGAVNAENNLKLEYSLAEQVLSSKSITQLVASACEKVISATEKESIKTQMDLEAVVKGEYKTLHKQTWKDWSSSFQKTDVAINIMVLHDIYSFYDKTRKWPGPWSDDAVGDQLKKRLFKNKATMRHNVSTVNEDTDWASRARWHDLPTWAGPSGTTYGLCRLLCEVGEVSEKELLACAYALFALWASPHYPKTATPIHHLFGVMTAVSEFMPEKYSQYWEAKSLYTALKQFLS